MKTQLSRRRAMSRPWRRAAAAGILLVMFALGACTGGDGGHGDAAGQGGGGDRAEQDALASEEGFAGDDEGATSGGGGGGGSSAVGDAAAAPGGSGQIAAGAARLPQVGPSVIKTATVNISVAEKELSDVTNEAVSIAGSYGGFVLSSRLGREGRGGTLTMRIPAEGFEAALAELEGLGKVRSETISGEDVGQQFVDLEARLRNWQAQEAVLLKLMDRAESVTDTIRVQSELSRIQLEIEQIRGRLRYLRDQTSLGTITATFAPLTPKPDAPNRFGAAWSRAVELMQSFVAGLIVTTGVIVPLAAIALVAYLIFRGVKPRFGA